MPERFDTEFDLVEALARASGRPLSMTWLQRDPGGEQWKAMRARVDAAVARACRCTCRPRARHRRHQRAGCRQLPPFMGFPGYKEIAGLPLAERAAALREPARKARILTERSERLAGDGTPVPPLVDILLARIEQVAWRMFPLGDRARLRAPVSRASA
jgi:hypothetical protein